MSSGNKQLLEPMLTRYGVTGPQWLKCFELCVGCVQYTAVRSMIVKCPRMLLCHFVTLCKICKPKPQITSVWRHLQRFAMHNITTSNEVIIRRLGTLQWNYSRCGVSSSMEHLSHGVACRWSRTVTVSDWSSAGRTWPAIIKHPPAPSWREASKKRRWYLTERGHYLKLLYFTGITINIVRCSWQSKQCNCHKTWELHPRRPQ